MMIYVLIAITLLILILYKFIAGLDGNIGDDSDGDHGYDISDHDVIMTFSDRNHDIGNEHSGHGDDSSDH